MKNIFYFISFFLINISNCMYVMRDYSLDGLASFYYLRQIEKIDISSLPLANEILTKLNSINYKEFINEDIELLEEVKMKVKLTIKSLSQYLKN